MKYFGDFDQINWILLINYPFNEIIKDCAKDSNKILYFCNMPRINTMSFLFSSMVLLVNKRGFILLKIFKFRFNAL